MQLTVSGVYRERSKQKTNLYSFQRTLVIVPTEVGGLCIKNEMLNINHATIAQIKTSFKANVQPKAVSVPHQMEVVEETRSLPSPSSPTISSSTDDAHKCQMAQLMSQRTNMNLEWSKK